VFGESHILIHKSTIRTIYHVLTSIKGARRVRLCMLVMQYLSLISWIGNARRELTPMWQASVTFRMAVNFLYKLISHNLHLICYLLQLLTSHLKQSVNGEYTVFYVTLPMWHLQRNGYSNLVVALSLSILEVVSSSPARTSCVKC
jgi:hypothetical protein